MPGSELGALHEMKQYQLRCQTRVSDTPLEVSPHNSNMINPNKAVTYIVYKDSFLAACSSLQYILSKVSDISTRDVYNFTARSACNVAPSLTSGSGCPELQQDKLAQMITLPFFFYKLYLLISCSLGFIYPLPLRLLGGNTSLSQQLACFSLSLSDK